MMSEAISEPGVCLSTCLRPCACLPTSRLMRYVVIGSEIVCVRGGAGGGVCVGGF